MRDKKIKKIAELLEIIPEEKLEILICVLEKLIKDKG